MAVTKAAADRQRESAREAARSVAIDLRQILIERRRSLDEFEKYVDSWDEALAQSEDPREFTQAYVVERAMEMVEGVTHTHSGGTGMMHVRNFRTRALQLLASGRAK